MKKQSILSVLLAFAMVLNVFCMGPVATALQAQANATSGNEVIGSNVLADVDFTESTLSELDGTFAASSGDSSAEALQAADKVSAVWNGGKATNAASATVAEPINAALGGSAALTNAANTSIEMSGLPASRLIDGKTDAFASTNSFSSADSTAIARITLKDGAYELSSVKVAWRDTRGYAKDFTIEVFHNNEWVQVAAETDYTSASPYVYTAEFEPILATAVRLVATKLTSDSPTGTLYYLQMKEFEAYGVKKTLLSTGAKASLTNILSGNSASSLVDGNFGVMISAQATGANDPQTAKLILKDGCSYVSDIVFYWRDFRGRPSAFHVDVFNAKTDAWETVATETGYAPPAPYNYAVNLETPILTNQVRLVSDTLTPENGLYYLQLKEIEVFGAADTTLITDTTPTADTPSWAQTNLSASKLTDGVYNNPDSGHGFTVATSKATVTFADSAAHKVNAVILYPRVDTTANLMPTAFTLEAFDGRQWVKIAEKSGVSPEGPIAVEVAPTVCSQVRLVSGAQFYLTEMEVFGEKVGFLKPTAAKADGKRTLLTVKDKQFTNFHAEIEMLRTNHDTASYGLVFGQTAPTSNKGNQSVSSYLNLGAIQVGASMKPFSAKYAEADAQDHVVNKFAAGSQFNYGADGTGYAYDKGNVLGYPTAPDNITTNTLNVEVVDGILKVWWSGFEKTAWTVELDGYQGGYVSLFSDGNDQGGFKSFRITELAASDITVETGVTIHTAGDYTVVELTDDMAKGTLKTNTVTGSLSFDSAKFEYRTAVFADESAEQNADAQPTAEGGKLGLAVKACNAGVVVKLFFKNLTDEHDYTGFALAIESITKENGDALTVDTLPETVAGDLTGDVKDTADRKIDIRDLVNADTNGKDTAIVQSGLLGTNAYAAEAEAVAGLKKN